MRASASCRDRLKENEKKRRAAPVFVASSDLVFSRWLELDNTNYGCFDNLVHDIFEVTNPGDTDGSYLLLPSGCPEMLFVLHPKAPVSSYLCGPLSFARMITVPAGGTVFSVQLKPGRIDWLVKQSAFHLVDRIEPLRQYLADSDYILSKLKKTSSFRSHCAIMIDYFDKSGAQNYSCDAAIQRIVEIIDSSNGNERVYKLAASISRSEDFLRRIFRDKVGLPVKSYCEIVKLDNSIDSILTSNHCLAEISQKYGYGDIPHMNRAYRKYLHYTVNEIRDIGAEKINFPKLYIYL